MPSRFADFLLTGRITPPRRSPLALGILLLLIAAGFGWWACVETGKLVRLAGSGLETEATVVETSRGLRGLPRTTHVRYWFMDNRRHNRFGDFSSTWGRHYKRGDKLRITYDERDPSLSALSLDWLFAKIMLYAALFVLAALTGARLILSFHSMTMQPLPTQGAQRRSGGHIRNLS